MRSVLYLWNHDEKSRIESMAEKKEQKEKNLWNDVGYVAF